MGRYKGDIYARVKALPNGESFALPLEKWGAARSVASRVGKVYRKYFTVRKRDGQIIVTRTDDLSIQEIYELSSERLTLERLAPGGEIAFPSEAEWKKYSCIAYNINKKTKTCIYSRRKKGWRILRNEAV